MRTRIRAGFAPGKMSAFTLIELLVVVAIISLLMALLLPALSSARLQAQSVRCSANLKSIGTAMRLYAEDNNACYPKLGNATGSGSGAWPSIWYWDNWVAYTMVYTNDVTPENAQASYKTISSRWAWDCPTNTLNWCSTGWSGNYAYNAELAYNFIADTGASLSVKPYNMPNQAELLVVTDAAPTTETENWAVVQCAGGQRLAGSWHNKGYNGAFLDGHVSWTRTPDGGYIDLNNFPQGRLWLNHW